MRHAPRVPEPHESMCSHHVNGSGSSRKTPAQKPLNYTKRIATQTPFGLYFKAFTSAAMQTRGRLHRRRPRPASSDPDAIDLPKVSNRPMEARETFKNVRTLPGSNMKSQVKRGHRRPASFASCMQELLARPQCTCPDHMT